MNTSKFLPAKVKKIAKILLNQDNKPLDLRKTTDNPIDALYLAKNRPFVINAEIDKCRSFFYAGYTYSNKYPNPAVQFLLDYKEKNKQDYKDSSLEHYSSTWQPQTAAQVLGFVGNGNSKIHGLPKTQFVYPWEAINPEIRELRLKIVEFVYYDQQSKKKKSIKSEKLFGPSNAFVLKNEAHRLISVYRSIIKNGYIRNNSNYGDIHCYVLVDGKNYVFLINGGTHRMAAVSALGYKNVPIRVAQIIRKEDASCWPHVKNGLFSYNEAMYIFDRIIDGQVNKLVKIKS